jgi:hypothetical protein
LRQQTQQLTPVITQFTTNLGEATANEVLAQLAKVRKHTSVAGNG